MITHSIDHADSRAVCLYCDKEKHKSALDRDMFFVYFGDEDECPVCGKIVSADIDININIKEK